MSSTLKHFSHPKHPLILKDDDIIGVNAVCYACNTSIVGYATYSCTNPDNVHCQNFYLHKVCAELPQKINHHKHNKHPLVLSPRPGCVCNACGSGVLSMAYACRSCEFNVCLVCVFEQRILNHQCHEEHALTLMQRIAEFCCDACGVIAKDFFYVCTTCDICIHKSCAWAGSTIQSPAYHHHPLNLIYSVPDMHRYFVRTCAICEQTISVSYWMYYCHKCTFFVHMRCAGSYVPLSLLNQIEADCIDNEPDLAQFPLPTEESLLDFIIAQFEKLIIKFPDIVSTMPDQPRVIEEHWSHPNHRLEQFELTITEIENDHNDDDRRALICDGCNLHITLSNPLYYACLQCSFCLHSFCATKLPAKLPAGASSHSWHSLSIRKMDPWYITVSCAACSCNTNGFFYECDTCQVKIDMRCAIMPARIKYLSHKHHTLVQRPFYGVCSVSKVHIYGSMGYVCETCKRFQIQIICLENPSTMKHKYDDHPITLRHPPFHYEGVFYCEICEEQVNNQWLLYHCDKCDHSFHSYCAVDVNLKLGGTIQLRINNQLHKLILVFKIFKRDSPPYLCGYCGKSYTQSLFFECDGCGFLACRPCVHGLNKLVYRVLSAPVAELEGGEGELPLNLKKIVDFFSSYITGDG